MTHLPKISILILRRDHQIKISYERCDYESLDEKSLSYRLCPEKLQKNNSGSKGLTVILFLHISLEIKELRQSD